jgi:hypothetical protein
VADEQFGRQVPFAFLEKVKEEFFAKWEDKAQTAIAHSMDKTFGCGGTSGVQSSSAALFRCHVLPCITCCMRAIVDAW